MSANVLIFVKSALLITLSAWVVLAQDPDGCPKIIKRSQWGAAKSTNVTYQIKPVQHVVIHHSATQSCNELAACKEIVESIQGNHQKSNKWSDIGYNFLIGNGGNVFEGIGWHRVGAHTRGYNIKSIGIAFIGDYSKELPSAKALRSAKTLLKCGVNLGELDSEYLLYGAKQLTATASPGKALFNNIKDWDNFDPSPAV